MDANSIGSVLPSFANYGLLSGLIGYFVHQLTAGLTSELSPNIISLSWEVVPLMQQAVKVCELLPILVLVMSEVCESQRCELIGFC